MPRPPSVASRVLAASPDAIRKGASTMLQGLRVAHARKCACYPDLPGRARRCYLRSPAIEPRMLELNMPTGSPLFPTWEGLELALLDIFDQCITGERGDPAITRHPSLEPGAIGVACVQVQTVRHSKQTASRQP